jgi:hypothetical protein
MGGSKIVEIGALLPGREPVITRGDAAALGSFDQVLGMV